MALSFESLGTQPPVKWHRNQYQASQIGHINQKKRACKENFQFYITYLAKVASQQGTMWAIRLQKGE